MILLKIIALCNFLLCRTNDLYNRACELGKYMEAKYLGTAQVSDDIGDQLYDQCTQLISQSEEAFQRITSKLSGYTMSSKDYDAIFDLVLNECTFGKILSVFSYGLYLSRIKFMNGLPIMNMAAHAISSQSEWIWDQGGLVSVVLSLSKSTVYEGITRDYRPTSKYIVRACEGNAKRRSMLAGNARDEQIVYGLVLSVYFNMLHCSVLAKNSKGFEGLL